MRHRGGKKRRTLDSRKGRAEKGWCWREGPGGGCGRNHVSSLRLNCGLRTANELFKHSHLMSPASQQGIHHFTDTKFLPKWLNKWPSITQWDGDGATAISSWSTYLPALKLVQSQGGATTVYSGKESLGTGPKPP